MTPKRTSENLLEYDRSAINQIILKEFGKTEADIKDYVNIIKEWTKTQHHLPEIPRDDLIEQFLIFNKFSVEKVKQKLDMYYTIRTLLPEFYENKHPLSPKMVDQSKTVWLVLLPKVDQNHCRVLFLKVDETCTPEGMDFDYVIAHVFNRIELFIQNDVVLETILICDLQHFKPAHLIKFNIMYLKKIIFILRSVYSTRIRALHFINSQPYLNILVNTIKSLIPKKLGDRVHFHKTLETLFQMTPKEIYPEDIGGHDVSLQTLNELWQEKFKEHKDRFDQLEKMKVNEELRPAPLENSNVLGYHGNFKKLDVD